MGRRAIKLTLTEARVLMVSKANPRSTPAELVRASRLAVQRAYIDSVLNTLAHKGLMEKTFEAFGPRRGKDFTVSITPAGLRHLNKWRVEVARDFGMSAEPIAAGLIDE